MGAGGGAGAAAIDGVERALAAGLSLRAGGAVSGIGARPRRCAVAGGATGASTMAAESTEPLRDGSVGAGAGGAAATAAGGEAAGGEAAGGGAAGAGAERAAGC